MSSRTQLCYVIEMMTEVGPQYLNYVGSDGTRGYCLDWQNAWKFSQPKNATMYRAEGDNLVAVHISLEKVVWPKTIARRK